MTRGYFLATLRSSRKLPLAVLSALLISAVPLCAQDPVWIENAFSSAFVVQDQKCGKFWFATGQQFGHTRYLYHGGRTATTVTSHVVFRVQRGNDVQYYCNTPDPFSNGGVRPQGPRGELPFLPYDSIYVSPGRDTIEVIWLRVGFTYDITMRFVAELPRNEYDDGADILLEFDYRRSANVFSGTDLGIFLMLDSDNGTIEASNVSSDNSSILTDRGYFSQTSNGKSYQKRYDEIPEYCMTGWFEHSRTPSEVFSIHRLTGTSLGGAPLTTPDHFAIGWWRDFRSLSWSFNADLSSKPLKDVATAMRWENLGDEGLVRTAFGTTSRGGNNLHICRGDDLFAAVRTQRVVTQEKINGPYTPMQFDVEVWVSNVSSSQEISSDFTFRTPVASLPSGSGRLWLDPSSPATVPLFLRPHETKKITWRVNVDPSSEDTLALLSISPLHCTPLVNIKGAYVPDDRPPIVERTGKGRDRTAWWTFRAFDRHPDFKHDTGPDRVEIVRNDGDNFRLILDPDPFRRCDTAETVRIRAEVIDTTKSGEIVFRLRDCNGNMREDSASYLPRPDIFRPELIRIDSADRYDPVNYPCATRTFEIYLEDRANQKIEAGDAGFGSIEVLDSTNFGPIEINFDRGGAPLKTFDPTASFRLRVIDPYFDADAEVRVADFAGNADTFRFHYCTIPDTLPPVVSSAVGAGNPTSSWSVAASDKRDWDRGLARVVEISNTNMRVTPWPVAITPGQSDVTGIDVEVVNDVWDGELTLEFRDLYYEESDPATYAAHSSRIRFTFTGIPDTMAPDIGFRRDLTVPVNEVVFTVAVKDTHSVGGEPYKYDHGLRDVTWSLTPNMRVRTPIRFTDNRHGANFQVEIIDPLAIRKGDTVCVEAVDSAGNRSSQCRAWPSSPDGKSPIFIGRLDAGRTQITGTAYDEREYDRGLGSVILRNEVNLKPYSQTGIAGAARAPVTIVVIDPEEPIAGELVIQDLVGELEGSGEQSIHTVVIPFELETAGVVLELPALVEGGEVIEGIIAAGKDFSGDGIEEMSFGLSYSANGTFIDGSPGGGVGSFEVMPQGTAGLEVKVETVPGKEYVAGEELGRVRFGTEKPDAVERFRLQVAPGPAVMNGGREKVVEVRTSGDPLASELRLPPPFMRRVANVQTVINGDCNRVLASGGTLSRLSGLAILGVYPQPTVGGGGGGLRLYVRDLPSDGAHLELVSLDGTSVSVPELGSGESNLVSEVSVRLPENLAAGVYFLRLSGSTGADQVKVLVVE